MRIFLNQTGVFSLGLATSLDNEKTTVLNPVLLRLNVNILSYLVSLKGVGHT